MLIKITERNSWEREAWSHILQVDKQEGQALNHLMTFVRVANKLCDEVKKEATTNGHGSMYAASRYSIDFYDSHEETDRHFKLKNRSSSMMVSKNSGYKNSELNLDRKISPARMKSALTAIRDKKENVLYKDFDSVFLKSKKKC